MNKVLKGLVAVVSAAAMAIAGFAGVASAMADDTPTITFPTDAKYQNHTYEVYQIFTGDLSATELKQLTDVNVADKTDQDKLAVIKTFAKLDSTAIATLTKTNTTYSAAPGYYLIKDKDASVSGNDANTLYITKVVGNVTISPKSDVPSFQKKVKDVNASTGVKTDWQDSADYDVNDAVPFHLAAVPFQLTATLPTNEADFAAYETYKLVFHDNQSAGLTFEPETVVVKYEGKTLNTKSYTLDQNPTDGHTFDITITDAKTVKNADGSAITVAAGGKFTVEYMSTLNENAVIGAAGNPNEAFLEFSNNPNVGTRSSCSPTSWTSTRPSTAAPRMTTICRSSSCTSSIAPRTITPLTVAR